MSEQFKYISKLTLCIGCSRLSKVASIVTNVKKILSVSVVSLRIHNGSITGKLLETYVT